MRSIMAGLVVLVASVASANETIYEGTWHVTNRELDGTMTCVVTHLSRNRWNGHFYGVWQGSPFSYQVKFTGPPEKLHGTAQIDGANYDWTGTISNQGSFKGTFGGDRYTGRFDLEWKSTR